METAQAQCQKHIGLMFGSYNPPHLGHVETADKLRTAGGLTEIWMLPIPQSPYKKDVSQVPFDAKLEMCRILAEPFDWLSVHDDCADFPATIPGQLQRYKRTIEKLTHENIGTQFSLVAGEDFSRKYREVVGGMAYLGMMMQGLKSMSMFKFDVIQGFADRVIRASDVFQKLDVMSSPRSTLPVSEQGDHGSSAIEISSSSLRKAIQAGADHVAGIPDRLLDYITRKGFYNDPRPDH